MYKVVYKIDSLYTTSKRKSFVFLNLKVKIAVSIKDAYYTRLSYILRAKEKLAVCSQILKNILPFEKLPIIRAEIFRLNKW